MGRYKSVLMAQQHARDYPFHVDVPVPPLGRGKQMDVAADWLNRQIGGLWHCHGMQVAGAHVARYMFRSGTDARAFRDALDAGAFETPPGAGAPEE